MQTLPAWRTRDPGAPPPTHDGPLQARRSARSDRALVDSDELQSSVQVLLFSLPLLLPFLPSLQALLSSPEQQRVDTLLSDARRTQSIAGRSLLRLSLASLLGCAPQTVPLTCSPLGKPTLADPASSLHFSVAHSGQLLGLAFTGRAAVGFDLERIDPHAEVVALAGVAWGASAASEFANIPAGPQRQRAFFQRWVRFEAAHKQSGEGIFHGTRLASAVEPAAPRRNLAYSDFTLPFNEDVFVGAVACPLPLPTELVWCERTDVEALLGR